MKVEIELKSDDVAENIKKDVTRSIQAETDAAMNNLAQTFKTAANALINELMDVLAIKDDRKRERARRAVCRNLDKWTKGGNLNG